MNILIGIGILFLCFCAGLRIVSEGFPQGLFFYHEETTYNDEEVNDDPSDNWKGG